MNAEENAGDHAVHKAQRRLLDRDPQLQPQRTVGCTVSGPVTELGNDPAWPAEEEGVDNLELSEQLPAAEDDDQRHQPRRNDHPTRMGCRRSRPSSTKSRPLEHPGQYVLGYR